MSAGELFIRVKFHNANTSSKLELELQLVNTVLNSEMSELSVKAW